MGFLCGWKASGHDSTPRAFDHTTWLAAGRKPADDCLSSQVAGSLKVTKSIDLRMWHAALKRHGAAKIASMGGDKTMMLRLYLKTGQNSYLATPLVTSSVITSCAFVFTDSNRHYLSEGPGALVGYSKSVSASRIAAFLPPEISAPAR